MLLGGNGRHGPRVWHWFPVLMCRFQAVYQLFEWDLETREVLLGLGHPRRRRTCQQMLVLRLTVVLKRYFLIVRFLGRCPIWNDTVTRLGFCYLLDPLTGVGTRLFLLFFWVRSWVGSYGSQRVCVLQRGPILILNLISLFSALHLIVHLSSGTLSAGHMDV